MPPRASDAQMQIDSETRYSNFFTKHSKRIQRRVAFAPTIRVRPIPHFTDLDESTHNAVWFTKAELQAIKQECVTTVQMMLRGDKINEDSGMCARGLEKKLPREAMKCRHDRRRAIQAVLEEQFMQWEQGSYDPEWIAEEYSEATSESKMMAYVKGIEDELKSKLSGKLLRSSGTSLKDTDFDRKVPT